MWTIHTASPNYALKRKVGSRPDSTFKLTSDMINNYSIEEVHGNKKKKN